jgi:transposase
LKQTYSSTLQISLDNEIHSCHLTKFSPQPTALELACDTRGISVLFLPKFHCELSFIEQCWGHAKRLYRQKPPSSSEEDLEKNLVGTLDLVTVEQMRK